MNKVLSYLIIKGFNHCQDKRSGSKYVAIAVIKLHLFYCKLNKVNPY